MNCLNVLKFGSVLCCSCCCCWVWPDGKKLVCFFIVVRRLRELETLVCCESMAMTLKGGSKNEELSCELR